ncbi:MAG: DNA polymerase III subunit gamma/tau [Planctomycetia bacterium]|jgi:DNA polymerase-3 subunit gamma/tau
MSDSHEKQQYVVVARRYRPQVFADLIGQEHIARALTNAIETNRVGHAYLFTGARGVGKTSAARIFAKALNCVHGPAANPCNECEICQSISSGDDVDVLEIDGASNRGIDEIRQLRQNANIRPSRTRMKIYIIDEVHMLTREAFNALLKTLEEPPEHVKFIFCTTDPNKLPITILSRCQRFDFAGIRTGSIAERLATIAKQEGVEAEPAALEVLSRRAAGSMRDGQSLLEQLLAFAPEKITVDDVHQMLGTAGDTILGTMVERIVTRDAAGLLKDLNTALAQGVDAGLLLEQLFGYLRDCMAAVVGCSPDAYLYASPGNEDRVVAVGKELGLKTILAAMQILDQTLARLRQSTQARVLAELALVRICSLENLDELATLIASVRSGVPLPAAPTGVKKNANSGPVATSAVPSPAAPESPSAGPEAPEDSSPASTGGSLRDALLARTGQPPKEPSAPSDPPQIPGTPSSGEGISSSPPSIEENDTPPPPVEPTPLTEATIDQIWQQVIAAAPSMLAAHLKHVSRVAISVPNRLALVFPAEYTFQKSMCERPDNLTRLQELASEFAGHPVGIECQLDPATATAENASPQRPATTPAQRLSEASEHPMVQRAAELFGAEPTRVNDSPKK